MTQETISATAARHALSISGLATGGAALSAVAAIAIDRLARSSLTIKRARIGSLEVDELWGRNPPTT